MTKILSKIFLVIFVVSTFTSCLPGASSSRPKIDRTNEDIAGGEAEVTLGCAEFYNTLSFSCIESTEALVASCPETTFAADYSVTEDKKRIDTFMDEELLTRSLTDEEIKIERDKVTRSRSVCLKVERPTNAITISGNICACKDGLSDIINDCDAICKNKPNSTEATLYGTVTLNAEVAGDESFGSLEKWCNATIDDGRVSPSCRLVAEDINGAKSDINITIPTGSNTFTVNIGTLAYDKTYVLRVVEKGSGSNAQTKAVQIRRIQRNTDLAIPTGPLELMPINQYTCYNRSIATDGGGSDFLINGLIYQNFYYPSNEEPLPLQPGSYNMICHDVNLFGDNDSPLYPRLMTRPGHMALWDKSDVRFFDTDSNGIRDIEDLMKQEIFKQFGQNITLTNIFKAFPWPTSPNTQGNIGYYMTTWSDPVTGRVFCPNQTHYNSNDVIFRVMKELVGVDTEAIYVGIKQPELFLDQNGTPIDTGNVYLLIRESELKKIWFYYENGQHFQPDDQTATQKTIRFYWPPDPVNPYVQKSSQRIYTIVDPSSSVNGSAVDDGTTILTTVPPPDKRFGCIPSIGN